MSNPKNSVAPNHVTRPALLLGLDNVVRRTLTGQPFPANSRDIELMPGIEDQILKYKDLGYRIFLVGNQKQVAHGLKTTEDIKAEMMYTLSLFKQNPFNSIRMCYYDPTGNVHPFNTISFNSLPFIGMFTFFEVEAYDHGIVMDWANSLFIGVTLEERQAAINAEIPFVEIGKFLTSEVIKFKRNTPDNPSLN